MLLLPAPQHSSENFVDRIFLGGLNTTAVISIVYKLLVQWGIRQRFVLI